MGIGSTVKNFLNELFGIEVASGMSGNDNLSDMADAAPSCTMPSDIVSAGIALSVAPTKNVLFPCGEVIGTQDSAAVIAAGMSISGSFTGEGDFYIYGEVKGDVTLYGDVYCSGVVDGNVSAANVTLAAGRLLGDISSKGLVIMEDSCVVIGDMTAENLDISGKVEGNLAADYLLEIRSTAAVFGDITANNLKIEPGAVISGNVHINK